MITQSDNQRSKRGIKRIPHDDIRMTIEVFGDGVHDQVSAKVERSLEVRRHEGVVDGHDDVVGVGNLYK